MKKITLLFAAFAMAAGFASCKKDYSCECSGDFDSDGTVEADEKYTYELKDVKKKDAKDACNQAGNIWILAGGTCDLK